MSIPILQIRGTELIILVIVIAILLFGATKIPQLARALGRAGGEFRKGRIEAEKETKEEELGERERLEKAARDLGINPEGMTVQQLRDEIQRALMK